MLQTLTLITLLFSFIPGLLLWLLKKDESAFLGEQGREALNFQITLLIAYMLSYGLMLVLIGFVMLGAVWLANIILCVVAAAKTSQGVDYRYPFTLRLIN